MDPIVFTTKPSPESLPGFWEPKVVPPLNQPITEKKIGNIPTHQAVIIENVLTHEECQELIKFMLQSPNFEEVGVQGMKDQKDERIGSIRTSIWSPGIAANLWDRLIPHCSWIDCREHILTDWWQNSTNDPKKYLRSETYTAVAVSPLLRFMQYGKNGQHYAHYDAGFIYPHDDRYRTLKSMVIYLTTNEGAATRFINDGQDGLPIYERKHDDWSRPVEEHEIIGKSECMQGNVLLFDHRMCHDVQQYLGNEPRIIIRGDIVYKR